jgi:hypothetical protein
MTDDQLAQRRKARAAREAAEPYPVINDAWGDVGHALYDVPEIELPALAARLHDLATADPGRAGDVLHAFAAMVETEQQWRQSEWRNAAP